MPAPADKPTPPTPTTTSGTPDWRSVHLWQIQPIRDGLVIAAAVGLVFLGSRLSIVTVPLLLAMLLAYLFEPLVAMVTRKGLVTRHGAAAGIIILIAVVVVVPVSIGATFAVYQGIRFVSGTAGHVEAVMASVAKPDDLELRARVPHGSWSKIRDYIAKQQALRKKPASTAPSPAESPGEPKTEQTPKPGDTPAPAQSTPPQAEPVQPPVSTQPDKTGEADASDEDTPIYRAIQFVSSTVQANAADINKRLVSAGTGILGGAISLVASVGKMLFGAVLTAFFFFFVCTSWGRVLGFWQSLIPDKRKTRVIELVSKMDGVIAGFVRGRLTIAACMMVMYTFGYWLAGVPAPLILGPVMGALVIVPYATAMVSPIVILLTWLDPPGGWQAEWWWIVGGPILVSMSCQFTDDYLLNPKIQGKNTNMDVPTILFASIAGGALAGFYGLLVAIPAAACMKILLNEVFWPRFRAWSHGEASDLLPIRKD
jgi:predicted PurR-regulated permease PerM